MADVSCQFLAKVCAQVLVNPRPYNIPAFANSVDSDQLASKGANWSGSALFATKYVN